MPLPCGAPWHKLNHGVDHSTTFWRAVTKPLHSSVDCDCVTVAARALDPTLTRPSPSTGATPAHVLEAVDLAECPASAAPHYHPQECAGSANCHRVSCDPQIRTPESEVVHRCCIKCMGTDGGSGMCRRAQAPAPPPGAAKQEERMQAIGQQLQCLTQHCHAHGYSTLCITLRSHAPSATNTG
jgi:hypothetical protein